MGNDKVFHESPYPLPSSVEIARLEEKLRALRERFEERSTFHDIALKIQAKEYERRLDTLNHAHEKAIEVQHTYVTQEKYEAAIEAEESARLLALTRIDEKFNEHVKRYELRNGELDRIIQDQANTTKVVQDAATKAALDARLSVEDQGRKTNRNLVMITILISVVVAVFNVVPILTR